MERDPILEEVHAMKAAFARKAGFDLHRMAELIRAGERLHPERLADI